jgi:hypothetical protein
VDVAYARRVLPRRSQFLALLAACFLPTLPACGGTTQSPPDQPFHPGKPGPSDEPPTLLSATAGSSLYVVAARASAGTVVAFGPALPADASLYDVSQLTVSADNSRVALVIRAKVGTPNWTSEPDTLLVGDGETWTSIIQAPSFSLSFQASKDLGLFEVPMPCTGSTTGATRSVIVRADGTRVFDEPNCSAESFVYAFAPDDSYFVLQDQTTALTVYPARPGATGVQVSPGGLVGHAFETSLIVFDTQGDDPNLGRWIDTSGAPLTVAGYAPYTGTPAGLLDIQGRLFALADRKVNLMQAMPPGAQPEEIAGLVGDGLVVLEADQATSARLVDAAGDVVGTYAPGAPITSPAPAGLQIVRVGSGAARWLTKAGAWILFQNTYGTPPPEGDGFQSYELSDDLWLLTDGAGNPVAKTVPIRHIATAQAVADTRTYVPSGDGKSVLYVEAATVHAIDVASGADTAIASSFQAGSIATRCDAGCVVF